MDMPWGKVDLGLTSTQVQLVAELAGVVVREVDRRDRRRPGDPGRLGQFRAEWVGVRDDPSNLPAQHVKALTAQVEHVLAHGDGDLSQRLAYEDILYKCDRAMHRWSAGHAGP